MNLLILLLALSSQSIFALPIQCADLLSNQISNITKIGSNPKLSQSGITKKELSDHVTKMITHVPEFEYIRRAAQNKGIRVWLFGGTASSFLHYVKWDLAKQKGLMDLQQDRFDYDFTNIFRSSQDLDVVVDGNPDVAHAFEKNISEKFPHFLGSKANKWEVRTLSSQMGKSGQPGFKKALLNDTNFNNQNTDSNSLGMVEITLSKEPVIRDLKHWNKSISVFLEDTINNHISFFRNDKHFTTSRAIAGENPEILSVIRLLVKAFQYELEFSNADFNEMKTIVNEFDVSKISNNNALRRIQDTAKKLVLHAVNIEYAINKLDELGLRQKLISMGNVADQSSDVWWLNREPLRSKKIGQGSGQTAKSLNIKIVAHETKSFMAYESITRSHSGEPNVLISRQAAVGETAVYGDGFYTRLGKVGARGTGFTIRFTVAPEAREDTDFTVHNDYIIFKNKKALKVIPESLNFSLDDLLKLTESNQEFKIEHSDLALLEKLKRKLNAAKITDEINQLLNSNIESDHDHLIQILNSIQNSSIEKLISKDILNSVTKNVYNQVEFLFRSTNEAEVILYIKTVSSILKSLAAIGTLNKDIFLNYLGDVIKTPQLNFNIKRQAVFELLLLSKKFEQIFIFKKYLTTEELKILISEINKWNKSKDPRKRKFSADLEKQSSDFIENGDLKSLKILIDHYLLDINHKNISQVSMLQLAAYYRQESIIDWLIANLEFDLNGKNNFSFNEVEQLQLSGQGELVDKIRQLRPEIFSQKFNLRERNTDIITPDYPNGTPIINFVRIEAGSFMMGDDRNKLKILTTISKSFEIMSVDINQKTYRTIVELIKQTLFDSKYEALNPTPSEFSGENLPVEQVSYDDIILWKNGLNEISKLENFKVQEILKILFPGHKLGMRYKLPTEAQWEFVSRLGGVAESYYSHGKGNSDLDIYSVNGHNSNSMTQPVGFKKPVFYNGNPIYDLHGNVWKWIEDYHAQNLTGGIDPLGPSVGKFRMNRGGSWGSNSHYLTSSCRHYRDPSERFSFTGFRLIRTDE
jgi:formylglycine-generating enzyme required for sulfatase activity